MATSAGAGAQESVEGSQILPSLTADQLSEVLRLLPGVDSVELKVSVPEVARRSVVRRLGMDPLHAQLRQVAFFDTRELTLSDHGIVVRARRIQRKPGDSVVKLRPVVPDELTPSSRQTPGFGVEVDAMPGGFVCSARLKAEVDDGLVSRVLVGDQPVRKLFTKDQRKLFGSHAPDGLELDDLVVLGPITILKLKLAHAQYARPLVAELWFYPDGGQILELSAKCQPNEAFAVAAETKAFLASQGVDLGAPQQTKTRTAMTFFASELASQTAGA
jgi:hypothetical protein